MSCKIRQISKAEPLQQIKDLMVAMNQVISFNFYNSVTVMLIHYALLNGQGLEKAWMMFN
jgi:hypothetical protein